MNEEPPPDLDDRPEVGHLFARLKSSLSELRALLHECSGDWACEDCVYRFYHHSFKVYALQSHTLALVERLRALLPDQALNGDFLAIISEGTGRTFSPEDNKRWQSSTRPIVEAFFHARYFLEMAVKYGHRLDYPPRSMPSGWAALLYLYNLR